MADWAAYLKEAEEQEVPVTTQHDASLLGGDNMFSFFSKLEQDATAKPEPK